MVYWLFVWTISHCCFEQCKIKQFYSRVLQGLVLGPLLFVVFYNDFTDHLKYWNVITNIDTKLNMDLEKISAYLHFNELVINLEKGKSDVMLFGSSKGLRKGRNLLNVMYEGNKITFLWHNINILALLLITI